MKNLHRKISAMLLAGMVVVGGVAVSGVSSFAASNQSVNYIQQGKIDKVKFYCKNSGSLLVFKNEEESKELVQGYSKVLFYNNRRDVLIKYPSEIPGHLQKAKYYGKKFVKLKYQDVYFLVELK